MFKDTDFLRVSVKKNRTIEKINFTSLLLEKSKRTNAQTKIEKNLFFL